MEKIKEIKLNSGLVMLSVMVPSTAYDFCLETNQSDIPYTTGLHFYDTKHEFRGMPNVSSIQLPVGNYNLMGIADGLSESELNSMGITKDESEHLFQLHELNRSDVILLRL